MDVLEAGQGSVGQTCTLTGSSPVATLVVLSLLSRMVTSYVCPTTGVCTVGTGLARPATIPSAPHAGPPETPAYSESSMPTPSSFPTTPRDRSFIFNLR